VLPSARAAAFAADGSAMALAARRLVEVLSLGVRRRSFAFRVASPVRALAIDGRGDRVAVSTLDGRIVVRSASGVVLDVRPRAVQTSLALDDAGRTLAGASGHRFAVWRVSGRSTRPELQLETGSDVTRLAVAPDGKLVAAASSDGDVRLYRVPGGAFAGSGLTPSPVTAVAFARDGRSFAVGSTDGIVRVFDTETGRLVTLLSGHRNLVTTVAFSRNGQALVAGAADGRTRMWDSGLAPELSLVARPPGCCTAIASAGSHVLVAAGRRTIEYVGRSRRAVFTQPSAVTSVAAAGRAAVTGGRDGRVRVWASPRRSFSLGAPISAVAATPTVIAAATRAGRVEVRSVDGARLAAFREPGGVAGLAVSADGRLLATAGLDGVGRIRDLRTGRLLHRLAGHTEPLTSVAFTPDGKTLATASFDHDIRVWDVESGRQVYRLRAAHVAVVSGVAFSPDGRWLVSAGPTRAGLWYAKSGVAAASLRGHTLRLVGAVFTGPSRIVTASVDGSVRAYRCDICGGFDELVVRADRRIAATGGGLTPDEQRRYLVP
jgi:WD40 repeat protein